MKRLFTLAVVTAFAFPIVTFADDVAPESDNAAPAEVAENDQPGPPPADRPAPPEGDEDFQPGPPPEDGDFRPEPPRRGEFRGPRPTPRELKFEDFDTNKDGVIDKEEFKKIQETVKRPPMPPKGDMHRGPHNGDNETADCPKPPKKGDMKKGSKKHAPKQKAPQKEEKTE